MVKSKVPSLSLLQKIKLNLFGKVYTGHLKRAGWSAALPFYLCKCSKHGLYHTYPQGYEARLPCPICQKEFLDRFQSSIILFFMRAHVFFTMSEELKNLLDLIEYCEDLEEKYRKIRQELEEKARILYEKNRKKREIKVSQPLPKKNHNRCRSNF